MNATQESNVKNEQRAVAEQHDDADVIRELTALEFTLVGGGSGAIIFA